MKTLQALVQDFFERHLVIERSVSRNTVAAYRDAMKLFLRHAAGALSRTPDHLDYATLDVAVVRSFLESLQRDRDCGPRTRNHRLAAIKSFAKYVASVAPEHLERCRLICTLTPARIEHPEIEYLDEDEVVKLIASVDAATPRGRRDRALLLLLYNTGARVQEIVDLDIEDIHDEAIPFVRLQGKGRKQRTCPLWSRTVVALQQWLSLRVNCRGSAPLFVNAKAARLSRSGVAYLLRRVAAQCGLFPKHARRLSPHIMRHTTAMHLLRSSVDITTIAAWLGHSQLSTTHGYVEIDLRMKQAAVASANEPAELAPSEFPPHDVIDWLESIGRPASYAQRIPDKMPSLLGRQPPLRITDRSP